MSSPTMVRHAAGHPDAAPVMVADWGGIQLTFHSEHRPIEASSRALEAAGRSRPESGVKGTGAVPASW